jgi:hypothetical protein
MYICISEYLKINIWRFFSFFVGKKLPRIHANIAVWMNGLLYIKMHVISNIMDYYIILRLVQYSQALSY